MLIKQVDKVNIVISRVVKEYKISSSSLLNPYQYTTECMYNDVKASVGWVEKHHRQQSGHENACFCEGF